MRESHQKQWLYGVRSTGPKFPRDGSVRGGRAANMETNLPLDATGSESPEMQSPRALLHCGHSVDRTQGAQSSLHLQAPRGLDLNSAGLRALWFNG